MYNTTPQNATTLSAIAAPGQTATLADPAQAAKVRSGEIHEVRVKVGLGGKRRVIPGWLQKDAPNLFATSLSRRQIFGDSWLCRVHQNSSSIYCRRLQNLPDFVCANSKTQAGFCFGHGIIDRYYFTPSVEYRTTRCARRHVKIMLYYAIRNTTHRVCRTKRSLVRPKCADRPLFKCGNCSYGRPRLRTFKVTRKSNSTYLISDIEFLSISETNKVNIGCELFRFIFV